jgi:hypothetical protein
MCSEVRFIKTENAGALTALSELKSGENPQDKAP